LACRRGIHIAGLALLALSLGASQPRARYAFRGTALPFGNLLLLDNEPQDAILSLFSHHEAVVPQPTQTARTEHVKLRGKPRMFTRCGRS